MTAIMLTKTLTLGEFDRVGTVCPTGSVFGHSEGEERLSPAPQRAGLFCVCSVVSHLYLGGL